MDIKQLVELRVNNEFKILIDKDVEQLHYPIEFIQIEHLPLYKQVRLEFEGQTLTCWKNGYFTFVIKYEQYPFQPPIIQFHPSIRHHQIIPGTGKYCLPELSTRFWKSSMKLEEIIYKVIQSFHQNPQICDYPVDLSIIELYLEDELGYKQYVDACIQNSFYTLKAIQQERQNIKDRKNKIDAAIAANQKK